MSILNIKINFLLTYIFDSVFEITDALEIFLFHYTRNTGKIAYLILEVSHQ